MNAAVAILSAQWALGLWLALSVRTAFVHTEALNVRLGLLLIIGVATGVSHSLEVLHVRQQPVTTGAAICALLVSAFLFRAALTSIQDRGFYVAFGGDVPSELVCSGPYRYVRHPLYSAYMIFWSSLLLLSRSPYVLLGVVVMAAFYVWAAREEERKLLACYGPDYAAYRSRTGMFIPKSPFERYFTKARR